MDEDQDEQARAISTKRLAWRLALAGFVPFAVLSLWLAGIAADHPWRGDTIEFLKIYAAVVLSFLGGIRWGAAMAGPAPSARPAMAASVLPPLAAWLCLLASEPVSFALLAVAFAAQGAWDAGSGGLPHWYGRLRVTLTLLVVTALVIAFAATA